MNKRLDTFENLYNESGEKVEENIYYFCPTREIASRFMLGFDSSVRVTLYKSMDLALANKPKDSPMLLGLVVGEDSHKNKEMITIAFDRIPLNLICYQRDLHL